MAVVSCNLSTQNYVIYIGRYIFRKELLYVWPLHLLIGFGLIFSVVSAVGHTMREDMRWVEQGSMTWSVEKTFPKALHLFSPHVSIVT